MGKKAESNLFKPQLSNFLTTGNKMNAVNNARLSETSSLLPTTNTANRPNMKANIKNSFLKDSFTSKVVIRESAFRYKFAIT